MKTITNWKDLTLTSLSEMWENVITALPNILGALLILLIGWLITKLILFVLRKILKASRVDALTNIINQNDLFGKTDLKFNVSKVILGFVKWIMLLVFLIIASDIMNWQIVSVEIGKLLGYLPKLFSALALFLIGLYVANFIKKALLGLFDSLDLNGSKIISSLVFYLLVVIISITALNQAGVNTDIITNNLTIILGSLLAAFALSFGLGSREIVTDLLRSFYFRKNLSIGQEIAFDNIKGSIENIDNLSVTIKTDSGIVIVPIKRIVKSTITAK